MEDPREVEDPRVVEDSREVDSLVVWENDMRAIVTSPNEAQQDQFLSVRLLGWFSVRASERGRRAFLSAVIAS